jgi:hypothetical protein
MTNFIIDFFNKITNFHIIVTILVQKFRDLEMFIKEFKSITNFIPNKAIF